MHHAARAAAVLAALALASPASAARITLGSTLRADAGVTLSQGADTAYWSTAINNRAIPVPADGQVVQIRIKGAAMTEPGAGPPANMVHFQSLEPAKEDGSRQVYLTSGFTDMPIDQPDQISTFDPENLCVHKGGAVAFNTIGGFAWNGGDPFNPNPINPLHYRSGTPWRIFSAATRSTTAWYSKDNGTKNGDILKPSGGLSAVDGYGATMRGRELLMQVVVATGQDRSEPCGGPRRHPDGSLVAPKVRQLRVAGGAQQRPYVTKDRRFTTGVYCETPGETCTGRAILRIGSRTIANVAVSVPTQSSYRVPMRLPPSDFRTLDRQGFLRVTYVLVSQFGRTTARLSLNR
ncbi:MAG: hypothetical protein JWM73_1694 [Solirubrobacterales bacterium]|nr:hypothetical protein [Solirubrobacterales bacterium]